MEGALKARHRGGTKKGLAVDRGQRNRRRGDQQIGKAVEKSNNKPKTTGK
jgi:hypothetical protein